MFPPAGVATADRTSTGARPLPRGRSLPQYPAVVAHLRTVSLAVQSLSTSGRRHGFGKSPCTSVLLLCNDCSFLLDQSLPLLGDGHVDLAEADGGCASVRMVVCCFTRGVLTITFCYIVWPPPVTGRGAFQVRCYGRKRRTGQTGMMFTFFNAYLCQGSFT